MRHKAVTTHTSGFTLPEMLVVVVVGLLVLTGLHRVFVAGMRTQTTTSLQTEVNRKAQVAVDDISARMRGAQIVEDNATDRISFIDQDGNNVRYWVDEGVLFRVLGSNDYSGGIPVASDVSEISFLYYDTSGQPAAASDAVRVVVRLGVERLRHSCVLESGVTLRNK
ncbi:MAG: prepilin-type N-terminal cleavage/methylation domain-containing protein [Proteobacteria bacterium]|nr:prepilin-type N-terminal cleavage/methylation domain-containing protein [Pseudomonadota bacterium]